MIAPPRIWGVTLDWEGAAPPTLQGGAPGSARPPVRKGAGTLAEPPL